MTNIHAQALGSLGGKARKKKTTLKQRQEWGRLGGAPRKTKTP